MRAKDFQFSPWGYIIRIFFLFSISIVVFTVLAEDGDALTSFINEAIAFFLLIVIAAFLLLKNKRLIYFFCIAYIVKLGIGVWHYTTFVDPNYFSGFGETNMLHEEFEAVFQFIKAAVSEKDSYGLLHLKLDGYVTHQELLSIMAIPFSFFGVKMLGIAPINTFFSLFATMNVFLISKRFFGDIYKRKYLLLLLAYFPATLLTDFFFRDIVGWGFMSIGLTMMCLSKTTLEKLISMLLAIPLFYLQRNGYVVIPILLLFADFVILSKKKNIVLIIISIIVTIVLLPIAYNLFSNESTDSYLEGATKWPIYLLPIKIIFGLIGPFPWTNILLYEQIPEVSFYLGDYIMGVFNIGVLIGLLKLGRKSINRNVVDVPFVMGMVLLLMGIMNEYMHMTYVSIGVFFLVPWLVNIIEPQKIKKNFVIALTLLLLLNVLVITLGLGGMSSSVR